jgi:hypothetical protein
MAYQIDRYNNTILTIVEDGTIDQTTDLKFIGKNYAGYGEIQNENFLYLLENFAGANQPPRALSGQVWFDSSNSKLKFYDGTKWRSTGGSEVTPEEPTGLTIGDFWWDSDDNQLYVYNGNEFILIGPQKAGSGITQMVSVDVIDNTGISKSIIAALINDNVMFTISSEQFTLGALQPSEVPPSLSNKFDIIRKGVTLADTQQSKNGVTDDNGNPNRTFYWGTASNADRLGGIPASEYLRSVVPIFDTLVKFADVGFTVGDDLDLKIYIEDGNVGVIENQTGSNSIIRFKTTNGTGDSVHNITLTNTGILPAADNTFELGSSTQKWLNVHAATFTGEATRAGSLREGSNFRSASVNATANTVAVRDSAGNLNANLFQGTATSARYADLAEKYTTDQEYPVGTVMAVGGSAETRAASVSDIVIGVISDKPAYLMNMDCEGQAIGLKGRVPVRILGPVSKGQAVYAWKDGVASTIASNGLVGIALETNNDEEEKLVECVLKV